MNFNKSSRCNECRIFPEKKEVIKKEKVFIAYVDTIKDGVAQGILKILQPDEEYQMSDVQFGQLGYQPPWPDIIFIKVRCERCASTYRVYLDWYHGRGEVTKEEGAFGKVPGPSL